MEKERPKGRKKRAYPAVLRTGNRLKTRKEIRRKDCGRMLAILVGGGGGRTAQAAITHPMDVMKYADIRGYVPLVNAPILKDGIDTPIRNTIAQNAARVNTPCKTSLAY
ncbi:MAG: hypothetical protein LBK73_00625 [Treponema sp.]|nr:hypothetical protein [Treponema sp.]